MDNVSKFPKTFESKSRPAITGTKPPLLVPGRYEAEYFGCDVKLMFRGRPKLFMTFLVNDERHQIPVPLQRYYNLGRFNPKDKTSFEIGWKSNLWRDYIRLFGEPENPESTSSKDILGAFEGKMFMCNVETVYKDSEGEQLGKAAHYSRIQRIEGITNV